MAGAAIKKATRTVRSRIMAQDIAKSGRARSDFVRSIGVARTGLAGLVFDALLDATRPSIQHCIAERPQRPDPGVERVVESARFGPLRCIETPSLQATAPREEKSAIEMGAL